MFCREIRAEKSTCKDYVEARRLSSETYLDEFPTPLISSRHIQFRQSERCHHFWKIPAQGYFYDMLEENGTWKFDMAPIQVPISVSACTSDVVGYL